MPLDALANPLVVPLLGLLLERPAHAYELTQRLAVRYPHLGEAAAFCCLSRRGCRRRSRTRGGGPPDDPSAIRGALDDLETGTQEHPLVRCYTKFTDERGDAATEECWSLSSASLARPRIRRTNAIEHTASI
jgi:hypothetical protein